MIKYIVSVFVFVFVGLFSFGAVSASASIPGCTAGVAYSAIDGQACAESVSVNPNPVYPTGCTAGSVFSWVNGAPCAVSAPLPTPSPAPYVSTCNTSGYDPVTGFRCGCISISGYSATTGNSCAGDPVPAPIIVPTPTPMNSTYPSGCTAGSVFSWVNGAPCAVSAPLPTPIQAPIVTSGCTLASRFSYTTGKPCETTQSNVTSVVAPIRPVQSSSPLACTITSVLKIGSVGPDVACLQSRIGLIADGKFGLRTLLVVKAFQSNAGLKADGIVGPKSVAALQVVN